MTLFSSTGDQRRVHRLRVELLRDSGVPQGHFIMEEELGTLVWSQETGRKLPAGL